MKKSVLLVIGLMFLIFGVTCGFALANDAPANTPTIETNQPAVEALLDQPQVEPAIVQEQVVIPSPEPSPIILEPITAADWYGVAYNNLQDRLKELYIPSVSEITKLTKAMQGEYNGWDANQIAGVPWCILNRVDMGCYGGHTISKVITHSAFAGYNSANIAPARLKAMAIDVVTRWLNEKLGYTNVGRVLPAEFTYFSSNGHMKNVYRTKWRSKDPNCIKWGWSLPSPYAVAAKT